MIVTIAVVGGDPVIGARGGDGEALRGGHAARERLGVGEQGHAGAVGIVVKVERDRTGRVVSAADRGLVGDGGADGGGGRELHGVGHRRGRGNVHLLVGCIVVTGRAVVAVAAV